jgi:hypothetical protein
MRLHQKGCDLGEFLSLERRTAAPGGGPDQLWFTVPSHAEADVDAPQLPGDITGRTTIVDYHANDGTASSSR